MPRIFIAVPVDSNVRAALADLPRHDSPTLRWVAEHQYHITLKFLGDIGEPDLEVVRSAVEQSVIRASTGEDDRHRRCVELTAKGVGAFPHVKRARIVWVGVGGDVNNLRKLQADIDTRLADVGFEAETRRFTPHITIARARHPEPLPASLSAYEDHDFGRWQVDHIEIIESQLSPSGPRYTVRHEIPLRG